MVQVKLRVIMDYDGTTTIIDEIRDGREWFGNEKDAIKELRKRLTRLG